MRRQISGNGAVVAAIGFLWVIAGCQSASEKEERAAAGGQAPGGANIAVQILAINDFHGQIDAGKLVAGRRAGSAPVLAAYLARAARDKGAHTLYVSAGDLIGASMPASALLQDEPSVMFFNQLGNASCADDATDPRCNLVAVPGNHEFDEGSGELLRLIRGGNHPEGPFLQDPYAGALFPYVCANIVREKDGKQLFEPYVIRSVGGARVAFIGAILRETPTITIHSGVEGLAFTDEAAAINRSVAVLKERGIRAIVAVIHQDASMDSYRGYTDPSRPAPAGDLLDIVRRLDDEVDVVVGGHGHAFCNAYVANAGGKKMLVTQAWSYGTAYADIDLAIDAASGEVVSKRAAIVTTGADAGPGLNPDPAAAALVASARVLVDPVISRKVGTAASAITGDRNAAGESALGNLIADAQRNATGADIAFMNPGGIRADIAAGVVTWGDLFEVQPFRNRLVKMELTGSKILQLLKQQWSDEARPRILQVSGLSYTWDPAAVGGNRVVAVRDARGPLDLRKKYSIVANEFLAEGGDLFTVFRSGTARETVMTDLEALVRYLEGQSAPFSASIDGRISWVRR